MSIQRNLLACSTALAVLLSPIMVRAADLKLGIADQRRGILTTDEGKQAQKDLEKFADFGIVLKD